MADDTIGYTESLNKLVSEFAKLPGIGRKTAERLSYHIMKVSRQEAMGLAEAVRMVKDGMKPCSVCCSFTEQDPCRICEDQARDHSIICVVEQPKDVMAIERSGGYRGLYHVLMGRISPLEGVDANDLTVDKLVARTRNGDVQEVILATNPDMEGDGTALYLAKVLSNNDVKVSRIARGLPSGSSIEYAAAPILTDALRGRKEL
jgi:recombination protein RecR